ncbi:MAG: glycoside hydrolase family 30 beta sandwich domain-containing protein [Patescibacteria group bacterium]|nr:glycoside hydrolase family 30 beta sandwich domain-containing protein [Patescibacteria group bacterium]
MKYPDWITTGNNHIKSNMYDEQAELLAATIEIYKNTFGVPITHVSLFNEPCYADYVCTTPEELENQIIKVKTYFQNKGITSKLLAPEPAHPTIYCYGYEWIGDRAKPYLDIYNYHQYGNFFSVDSMDSGLQEIGDFTRRTNIPNWQTEMSNFVAAGGDGCRSDTFEEGLFTALHIHKAMTLANTSAWFYWMLATKWSVDNDPETCGDASAQRLVFVDVENDTYWKSPKYWAMRQFSGFIPPGSKRIDVSGEDRNIYSSAYLHSNGTFTLVVINSGNSSRNVEFILNNVNINSLNKIRFSKNEEGKSLGSILVSGNTFSDILPPRSVTTYTTQSAQLPPSCSCTAWQDDKCGGTCPFGQMQQKGINCTPSGCSLTRCVDSSACQINADLNGDGRVNIIDLGILCSNWGRPKNPKADLDKNDEVNLIDAFILIWNWTG